MNQFNKDRYPGKPKILFIGNAASSHTHSWIDLLVDAKFNVRLFGLKGIPPVDWQVKTYIADIFQAKQPINRRKVLFPYSEYLSSDLQRAYLKTKTRFYPREKWLAKVINTWKPDIIHTLGLESGELFLRTRENFTVSHDPFWVLQLRGGSDLTLAYKDPSQIPRLTKSLQACGQIISDNTANYDYLQALGISSEKIASIAPVPGTGGIDLENMDTHHHDNPSLKRMILWPKAYTTVWANGRSTFEALKLAWHKIQPCTIYSLWTDENIQMWYWTLPEDMRNSWKLLGHIPREEALDLMSEARVLLAPSLVDGVPNVLYEAMATKTFPIVSPLPSITPVVENETNVLFARNLYPEEIAKAIVRAMNDDELIDTAAENNLELVKKIANRAIIKPKVIDYYHSLLRS
jgi:glycosyltransferase involved in cell wall biosynthesis